MANENDRITEKVLEMYRKYPYPSPSMETKTNELLNLLRIFSIENNLSFDGKNILDAGTGTGHRLIHAASYFKKTKFTGIDISENSLEIAKKLAGKNNLQNTRFMQVNLMKDLTSIGKYEIILCMGVIHHLSEPTLGLKNLLKILDDGIVFLYLYGKLGGQERMRKKRLLSLLLDNKLENYDNGIKMVRELQFNNFEYGWDIDFSNENEENSLIVDAFLHANEKLYDFDDINDLMSRAGFFGFMIFGITTKREGMLYDTRTNRVGNISLPQTDVANKISSKFALDHYEMLNVKDKCRVLDILFEPNGYTILGLTKKSYEQLSTNNRIKDNFIRCTTKI